FSTAEDNQPSVEVHVLQGEAETVYSPGSRTLGRFQLVGIPSAPRGMPQIEVTFDIDANGIVHVAAKDLGTGKAQAMTITGGTAPPKEEMEKRMREAQRCAEEDRRRREVAEARNMADNLSYQTEKTLKDHGDKLSDADRRAVEQALGEVKDAPKSDDVARIKAASDALVSASHKLAEQISHTSQGQQGDASGTGGGGQAGDHAKASSDDDDVDAEIVEEGGSCH